MAQGTDRERERRAQNDRFRLDNVGKFYSAQAGDSYQTVFRFSAVMADDVDPDCLQQALDAAVAAHPSFNVTLRSGFFWHYLEPAQRRPEATQENLPVCAALHIDTESTLFRVTYFCNRINVEVSHMISDGRGTMGFFSALVEAYCAYRYGTGAPFGDAGAEPPTRKEAHRDGQWEDSYSRHFEKGRAAKTKMPRAYRLPGVRDSAHPAFLEYHCSAAEVLARSRACGVSLTSWLIAAVMAAVRDGMTARDRQRAIVMDVPVDLRNQYGSTTAKNFFGLTYVSYVPGNRDEPVDAIARNIQEQLKAGTQPDAIKGRMNAMVALEKNPVLRMAPLFLKDLALNAADWMSARDVTTTVSSLGRITLDGAAAPFVKGVSVMTSSKGLNFVACTYEDDLCIGISSAILGLKAARRFCETMKREGIDGYLEASAEADATKGPWAAPLRVDAYPAIDVRRKDAFALGVLGAVALIALAAIVVAAIQQVMTVPLAVGGGLAVAISYLFLRNVLLHQPDFLRIAERYFLVLLAIIFLMYAASGHGVLTAVAVPAVCCIALIINGVFLALYRGRFVTDYAKYLIYTIILGALPLALAPFDIIPLSALSIASAVLALLLAAVLLVFVRQPMEDAARKLFNA